MARKGGPKPCLACIAVAGPVDLGNGYERCSACGLETCRSFPEDARSLYDKKGRAYFVDPEKGADYVGQEAWLRRAASFFADRLEGFLCKKMRGLRVIEISAATGVFLAECRKRGAVVRGVEVSSWACRRAQDRFDLSLFHGTLHQMAETDGGGRYDVAVLIHTIEHLPDIEDVLSALCRLLAPRGILMIATPDTSSPGRRWFASWWQYYLPGEHLVLFDPANLALCLERHGFEVKRVERYLWRKTGYLLMMAHLGFCFARYFWFKLLGRHTQFPNGTCKDGMIVFARRSA